MNFQTNTSKRSGFTLVEIMIVVLIIGLLAALAVPAFAKMRQTSRATTFANDIRALATAAQNYILESGEYPPDSSSGVFPNELDGYLTVQVFEDDTPLGGLWDFEFEDEGGYTSAVGVVNPSVEDEDFLKVDEVLDDGNLSTGSFVKISSSRYYYILQP
ncbi:MAG: type II secretion system protein [Verrucomicrobiota bacterium]